MSVRLIKALEDVKTLPEITVETIVSRVESEALLILCLICILPFLQPIPVPGLSTFLGLIVLLQGIGMMLWSKPLLTKKLREVPISHDKFEYIYKAGMKFDGIVSKLSAFKSPVANSKVSHIICGLAIILSAAFLALPLPIPFSNFIPALSIFLICVGLLEEDLVLILMGLGITAMIVWMTTFSYHIIAEIFNNYF